LTDLVSTGGPILNASNNAGAKIKAYNVRLTDLNVRMQTVLDRYTKQFAAMDAMVGKMNSLRDSLKSQFDNMSNSNK
jgi:flagellar capping protein FliD